MRWQGSGRLGFGSRTKTEQRPASRGEETEEEEEEAAAAAAAAGAEPWVEAGPAANGKLFVSQTYINRNK